MTILVTGGAGYIGAHVVAALHDVGVDVVIVDDLSTSVRERVAEHHLVKLDLATSAATAQLSQVIGDHRVDGVVHLAARKQVAESVARPVWYFQQNVGGLTAVLEAMRSTDCRRLVFSSSAAVYGEPSIGQVDETVRTEPINPYGETKLAGEWLVRDAARAWGLKQVSLRYFNVAGAGRPGLGDPAVLNLVTMVFDRLERGAAPLLFGRDYPTRDGSCIRDFVHVADLASAHVAALDRLAGAEPVADVLNVGQGRGVSVLEMLDEIGRVTGLETTPEVRARRPGDPAMLVARAERIAAELGWRAHHGLDEIVSSAWAAWRMQRQAGIEPIRAVDQAVA
jgi:UDP-glucose 4-epimerase